jgi:hypothetical protein
MEGGMSDTIPGELSPGEFIVPADVVSMLGDGSTESGGELLYDMMRRVRQEKTGSSKQANRLANPMSMIPV